MQRFLSYIQTKLDSIFTKNEITSITRLLLKKVAGMNSVQVFSNKDIKFPDTMMEELCAAVERLSKREPVQYILGETEFYGLNFLVKQGALIPRPETEELVDLVIKDISKQKTQVSSFRILDIGTGSGCIAVSLAKNCPNASVSAWDISADALQIAIDNAELNKVTIDFHQLDILSFEPSGDEYGKFDVMVSNPPYVCLNEQPEMEAHVLDFEPHLALFVENDDPFLFYRIISQLAVKMLKKGGGLYFEINSHFGVETQNLIQQYPFSNVELFSDLSGRDRIIRAIL